jgi:nitrate/nitrite-specific signal transduction histidine kinase
MSQTTKSSKSVADHIRALYQKITDLDARLSHVEAGATLVGAGPGPTNGVGTPPVDAEILAQVVELEHRLRQLETENRSLSDLCNQLQEQHAAISNLYVAKHRLHASLDAAEVMRIVKEIMVELVGAKEFGIYLIDPRQRVLRRVSGGGTEKHAATVELGDGQLGQVASLGKPFYFEGGGERPSDVPLAVIPLRGETDTLGIISIWKLLPHKAHFGPVDHQLLDLVAEHAPAAMKFAHLHQKSRGKA